jgi:hypothetical protein
MTKPPEPAPVEEPIAPSEAQPETESPGIEMEEKPAKPKRGPRKVAKK